MTEAMKRAYIATRGTAWQTFIADEQNFLLAGDFYAPKGIKHPTLPFAEEPTLPDAGEYCLTRLDSRGRHMPLTSDVYVPGDDVMPVPRDHSGYVKWNPTIIYGVLLIKPEECDRILHSYTRALQAELQPEFVGPSPTLLDLVVAERR